ncbi:MULTISPECIES: IDEAL domain-containing protein [Listeria]|uniref:IDEAL domain-containing protein n=1 Tax=Listeria TaxID=1637 RepID=UPI000B593299|nr:MULTISPECIES: IDEAL domain-containing protein [Listeria]
MALQPFSSSLSKQYEELAKERALMNTFIECYMTMLGQKQRIARIQTEIDLALDDGNKKRFILLSLRLKRLQEEELQF